MVIHVRSITNEEGNKLRRIVRRGDDPVELRRAQVILSSAQGFTPPKIGLIVLMSPGYVRTLIHHFNKEGFKMLKPHWNPGVSTKFTEEQKQELISLATSRPKDLGLPFQQWSLNSLRNEALKREIVDSISREWLRIILEESKLSFQSIKTWKESKDPEFDRKKRRIERLTRRKSNPPIVLSADEMGPFSLKPYGGKGWFEKKDPDRIPANYHKYNGTRLEYICLDVYHQNLTAKQYLNKGGVPWLDFLKRQRSKYPSRLRVYMIQDGLFAHWTDEIRSWARKNMTTLVPTATNASWMNPVESHTGDIQKLALAGTDYKRWKTVDKAFRNAVKYRNSERKMRGKKFRDTQFAKDGRRKATQPLWMRH